MRWGGLAIGIDLVTEESWISDMNRDQALKLLQTTPRWNMVVVGGGATGASIALDAASRGLRVALIERDDFGKGTSSRSTKLVHGGVRYLAQGNVSLVREALHERTLLRENAPQVVHELSFLVPCANRLQHWYYGLGFLVYDFLAGRSGFTKAKRLRLQECQQRVPTIAPEKSKFGILYSDGQFDDSRLLIDIVKTASSQGAVVCNYIEATGMLKNEQGRVIGVQVAQREFGGDGPETFAITADCVINATGPFCDELRRANDQTTKPMIAPSQGVHIVLDRSFLPGDSAVIVPKTSDGRVIFMIPWLGHTVIGTTDTPIGEAVSEPIAREEEIDFLLKTSSEYLSKQPKRSDILSVFTGIRPLVRSGSVGKTSKLSRDHTIEIASSGLITITGGKWTTARKMAQDCVDQALVTSTMNGVQPRPCTTRTLSLNKDDASTVDLLLRENPAFGETLVAGYPYRLVDVVFAVRYEMARSIEDILARRTRLLFLNASAALQVSPTVARIISDELNKDSFWIEEQLKRFREIATYYLPPCIAPSKT